MATIAACLMPDFSVVEVVLTSIGMATEDCARWPQIASDRLPRCSIASELPPVQRRDVRVPWRRQRSCGRSPAGIAQGVQRLGYRYFGWVSPDCQSMSIPLIVSRVKCGELTPSPAQYSLRTAASATALRASFVAAATAL